LDELVKQTITINRDLKNNLQTLAKNSDRSLSSNIRTVLKEHVESSDNITISTNAVNVVTTEDTIIKTENKDNTKTAPNNSDVSIISNQGKFRID